MTATPPTVQVLVDWVNPAFGAGATGGAAWTDISGYVRTDQPLSISRGRQDNISQVQPGRASIVVDNSDGRFTPGLSSSPYGLVTLGRRVQVNVADETGTMHTRFDGQISEIDLDESATGTATATLVCADVLAELNRGESLGCATVEYANSLGPVLQYVADEPAKSTGLKDSSGNNGPTLAPRTYKGVQFPPAPVANASVVSAPTYTFASGNSPVEGGVRPEVSWAEGSATVYANTSPLPSVYFGATVTAGSSVALTAPSVQFESNLPAPMQITGTSQYYLCAWHWLDTSIQDFYEIGYWQTALCLGNTRTGEALSIAAGNYARTYGIGGYYTLNHYKKWTEPSAPYANQGTIPAGFDIFAGPVMSAVAFNGTTCTFTVCASGANSVVYASASPFGLAPGTMFNRLSIGGILGGGNGWTGNISNVCLFDRIPSAAEIANMSQLGMTGTMDYPAYQVPEWVLGWAGVPPYWTGTIDNPSGSKWDYYDLTGSNYTTVLGYGTQVEHGTYFTDAGGRLNLAGRARRMGYGAPKLTLPEGSYNTGLKPKWTGQGMINSESLASSRGGQGAVAENADSIAIYGEYPNGTIQSPQQAPWETLINVYPVSNNTGGGNVPYGAAYDNSQLIDAASWDVNTSGNPGMALGALTVDMLANTPGSSEYVAPSALFGCEIGDVIKVAENLPWWPDDALNTELFIEGVTESYSGTTATVAWYTSPAVQGRAWIPGDPAYGVLGSTARLGVSSYQSNWSYPPPVPSFSGSMNALPGTSGYVSSRDIAGMCEQMRLAVAPPLLNCSQQATAQTLATGTAAQLAWDTVGIDTALGIGAGPDANDYIIPVSGWYEIYLTVQFSPSTAGQRTAWISHTQNAVTRTIAPVSIGPSASASERTGVTTSALAYCYQGDAVGAYAVQDSGASLALGTANGGSHMSLRYIGDGTGRN